MEFKKVLKDIQNKNARRRGVKAFQSKGKVFFSRLFGFSREGDYYVPIQKHAEAIRLIYQLLIDGNTLPDIKMELDRKGFRDGSNNRYNIDRIVSLVRPIYSGYLKRGLTYSRVTNIEPIVTFDDFKKAQKNLTKEVKKIIE